MRPLESQLRAGLGALGLDLAQPQVDQLLDYLLLIQKWTRVYNLTAVRDPEEMLTHHLLDSLAILNPLRAQLARLAQLRTVGDDEGGIARKPLSVLDVGSGAGLPGVVIAIGCPDVVVHCVDTVAKKAAFIQQVAATLKLPNLRGNHGRVEAVTERYPVVCSRAFASLADFTRWSGGALAEGGVWLAMKGKEPTQEMAELPPELRVFHVEHLTVPGMDAQRCIVWIDKLGPNSDPRVT